MAENVKYPQDEEKNEYRYIDFAWLDEIAMGLTAGAKKHLGETWREIPAREHVARAIRHLSMHQTGDSSEPHLINASMHCMMAFATATGRATMAERMEKNALQVSITACNNRQYEERKKPKAEKEASRSKTEASARAAEEARRKEAMAHLGNLTREAHEAGLSYGQYMAKKRMAKGECI